MINGVSSILTSLWYLEIYHLDTIIIIKFRGKKITLEKNSEKWQINPKNDENTPKNDEILRKKCQKISSDTLFIKIFALQQSKFF